MDTCQLPPKPAVVRKAPAKPAAPPVPVQSCSQATDVRNNNRSNASNVTNVNVYPSAPTRRYTLSHRQPTTRYKLVKESRLVVFVSLGTGPLAHRVSDTSCNGQTCSAVVKPRYIPDVGAGFLYSHKDGLSGGAMATGRGSFYGLIGWGF